MTTAAAIPTMGDQLNEAMAPWMTPSLATFNRALSTMFDPVTELVYDRGVEGDPDFAPGWSILFDVDLCPEPFLGFLAQFVGVTLPPELDEAAKRLRIRETDGRNRGTAAAMQGAARQFLVGPDGTGATATVYLIERHGGPYNLTLTTLASETPDAAKVLRAVTEQKPAGILLTVSTVVGGDLKTLRDTHLDLAEIASDFSDLDGIRSDPSHT